MKKIFLLLVLAPLQGWADQACLAYQFSCFPELNQAEVRLMTAYDCPSLKQEDNTALSERGIHVLTYDNPKKYEHMCKLGGSVVEVQTEFTSYFHCKYGDDLVRVNVKRDGTPVVQDVSLSQGACENTDRIDHLIFMPNDDTGFVVVNGEMKTGEVFSKTFYPSEGVVTPDKLIGSFKRK